MFNAYLQSDLGGSSPIRRVANTSYPTDKLSNTLSSCDTDPDPWWMVSDFNLTMLSVIVYTSFLVKLSTA